MQEVALHTKLKPDAVEAYERVHAMIPRDLDAALRAAGVRSWTIWRDGLDLFHRVEVEDWTIATDYLRASPADIQWQGNITEVAVCASTAVPKREASSIISKTATVGLEIPLSAQHARPS